jgi:heterodisulfide reductase subunit A
VESVSGEEGNFTVNVRQQPRYVDPDKCIACGLCVEKCPKKVVSDYDAGFAQRRAIYLKYAQAVPGKLVIDAENCIYFAKNGKCKACEKFCPTGAVRFQDEPKELTLNVGAIVLAPGYEPYNPANYDIYNYSRSPNVVTSLEFERILAATGPYGGHLVRPSDEREPDRIAWIQCVGSRDVHPGTNAYCSAVCCMYAIKQALIAKEHSTNALETTIFYIDMRTHGKDFERYYNRAVERGVRFVRSRISQVVPENNKGKLRVRHTDEFGRRVDEGFDIVVLSVGLQIPDRVVALGNRLGLEIDPDGFCATTSFRPVASSRAGIFVCGVFQGPKDIPRSVMEASAAASAAGRALAPVRSTLTHTIEEPPQLDVRGEPPRTGVFVCHCGVNIAGVVDVETVRDFAKELPHVAYAEDSLFSCSQDAQERLLRIIQEQELNRVVVAACSPRTHETLFQRTLASGGLNKYLFVMANIRNHDSWVHAGDPQAATEKAKDLVRMAVAKASLLEPLQDIVLDVKQSVLVVGGGVAGMVAALELADQGFPVHLADEQAELGGYFRNIRKTWRGESVSSYLEELLFRVNTNELISVYLNAQLSEVKGLVGNFESTLAQVNGDKTEEIAVQHGAAILAPGAYAIKPEEYLYGRHPRVFCWHEMENAFERGELSGADCAAFIQCVGSREPERPYCSRICCAFSIQRAIDLKEAKPTMDVYVLYRDIRTYGRIEHLYRKARTLGVMFIRYAPEDKPTVETDGNGHLQLIVKNQLLQRRMELFPDFITLASAIETRGLETLAQLFKVPLNEDKFFVEAHAKLRPVEFANDGVYLCGMAHYPKPLNETISQAQAAASRAMVLLSKESLQVSGLVAGVNAFKCSGCSVCVSICPYGASEFNKEGVAEIKGAMCKGCGLCVASCRSGAIDLKGFEDKQIFAMIAEL